MRKVLGSLLTVLFIVCGLINSCKKKPDPTVPSVTTMNVTKISQTSAESGVSVIDEGGASIISKGICWNTSVDPTIANNKTSSDISGIGTLATYFGPLTPNTKYYVRAYGTNSVGTGYGNQVSFTTSQIEAPDLITTLVTEITQISAFSGGEITDDKGGFVISRGVCYGTSTNPTIADNKTTNGTGMGSFVSNLTNLTGNTTYYVRAYATNSAGTRYGNELIFKTSPLVPTISTATIYDIKADSATSGGNISSDGGATVSVRGVCWSTAINPTIELSTKTSDGTGTGVFTSSISGLSPGVTYYVRAYATNISGTGYGAQLSFTSVTWPTLELMEPRNITPTSFTIDPIVVRDGGGKITERGVRYSTSQDLTSTSALTQIADGSNNTFTCNVTGLTPNTIYYVSTYAKNDAGIAYTQTFRVKTKTGTINDIDGNIYFTETIGTQVWMSENLKTTKYKDGTAIPLVEDDNAWGNLVTPGYCWYKNDASTYKKAYGALYNWYAVNTGMLCPDGWHVPTDTEWHTLVLQIDPDALLSTEYDSEESKIAGSTLTEWGTVHWQWPNAHSFDIGWFTALPGGVRSGHGVSDQVKLSGFWWSSTKDPSGLIEIAFIRSITYKSSSVYRGSSYFSQGNSVRCVKNN